MLHSHLWQIGGGSLIIRYPWVSLICPIHSYVIAVSSRLSFLHELRQRLLICFTCFNQFLGSSLYQEGFPVSLYEGFKPTFNIHINKDVLFWEIRGGCCFAALSTVFKSNHAVFVGSLVHCIRSVCVSLASLCYK